MATSHREVETKYDVEETTALPSLDDLPDVARVDGPRTIELEARYFDTEDLALGRRGITLRRRTGGDDEGWHLKLPVSGARQEIHAPLGLSALAPPPELRRVVQDAVRDNPVREVATISTRRVLAALLDAEGSLLAEVTDDTVTATPSGPQAGGAQQWREWEVELHADRPELTRLLDERIRGTGARVAGGPSKFGRLMQLDPDAGSSETDSEQVDPHVSEHELLARHLSALVDDLHRLDPMARADLPDGVHQLRLVVRRLRSALRTFDACFDTGVTGPVSDELHWIGDVLGRPRDLEVLQDQLAALVLAEEPRLVRDDPGTWIGTRLQARRSSAHRDVLTAMGSDRYFALLDTLDGWRASPPWGERRDRRAGKRFPKLLDHGWRRVAKAVGRAVEADGAERAELLHKARKRAKRVRYAAEVLRPVLGRDARKAASKAKKVQRALGAHHDAVVAVDEVLALADAAHEEGRDTFTFGILVARLEAAQAELDAAFRRTWKKVG